MKRIIGLIATALMLAVCSAPAQAAAPFPAHAFDRIFVIIFENKTPAQVLSQPYFGEIAKRGVLLKNYRAVAKPSQPNYIAMLAGNTLVRTNASYNLPQRNLVDLMEEAGVSWKAYMEAYPGKCFAGGSYKGLYARKHNPFISFNSVRNDPLRCAKVVNADQLEADIAGGALPRFSFYVPDMNNSGHDKPVSHADAWLRSFLEPKLDDDKFMRGTLLVITFDEGLTRDNAIFTVLLSEHANAGVDPAPYTHYSLLRTVIDNFALRGPLTKNDAGATPFDVARLVK